MMQAAWFMLAFFAGEVQEPGFWPGSKPGFAQQQLVMRIPKSYASQQACESDIEAQVAAHISPQAQKEAIGVLCLAGFVRGVAEGGR